MKYLYNLSTLILAFAFLPMNSCTLLSGEVSGVLQEANNPYQVIEDIIVPENATLRLDKRVKVEFAPGTGLKVYGQLIINGSKEDKVNLQLLEGTGESDIVNDTSVQLIDGDSIDSGKLSCYNV